MSSAFTFDFHINSAGAEQVLDSAAARLPLFIHEWLVAAADLTKQSMSHNAPEGVGAVMGQGIKGNIDIKIAGYRATIAPNSNAPEAIFVEEGTRPHRPPTYANSSFVQWCELKGLNVYAVARSIEKKGTKANPFVKRTYGEVAPGVNRIFERGLNTFIGGLS